MPAQPGFQPLKIVLDETVWSFQENSKGNRLKKYCTLRAPGAIELGEAGGWFWKESDRKYPHEFWSEILACRLGAEMGVPVPATHLGIFEGMPGSLAETLLAPGEELVEAADIMAGLDDGYERQGKGERQTVDLARLAISAVMPGSDMEPFHRMLVFDAWIGNQDRHHENWGFAKSSDGPWRFADVFDNGSSLLRELSNDVILEAKLGSVERRVRYFERSTSEIRWEPGGKVAHATLMARCAQTDPIFRQTARSMLSLDAERIESAVREIASFARESGIEPGISTVREGILVDMLVERRLLLLERLT